MMQSSFTENEQKALDLLIELKDKCAKHDPLYEELGMNDVRDSIRWQPVFDLERRMTSIRQELYKLLFLQITQ